MKQYFVLRCKQLAKYLPGMFLAMLVLLGSLLGVFSLLVRQDAQSEDKQKFQIALVGFTDDPFLQLGLSALESFDSTRFALDIWQLTKEQAQSALARGEIAAYVVIPENFVDEAMDGNIIPLDFVSTTGATGLVSIVKDELTIVISNLLLNAQKGVYGMADVARKNGIKPGKHMDALSIDYAEQIFLRDRLYTLEELGIADELGFAEYLLCGFSVLFLLLCCLPFGPLMIRKDLSLLRMLAARGRAPGKLLLAEYAGFALMLAVPVTAILGAISIFAKMNFLLLLLQVLPVVILVSALSFMLYCLSTDLIGGVLLQFFTTLGLCFVSGCLYPVYFFPSQAQRIAAWLPAGIARSQLSGILTGNFSFLTVALLLGYSAVFVAIGASCTTRRIREVAL